MNVNFNCIPRMDDFLNQDLISSQDVVQFGLNVVEYSFLFKTINYATEIKDSKVEGTAINSAVLGNLAVSGMFLFSSHLARLRTMSGTLPQTTSKIRQVISSSLFPLTAIAIYSMADEFMLKEYLSPLLISVIVGSSLMSFFNTSSNSLPKLKNCYLNLKTKPLQTISAGLIHAANIIADLVRVSGLLGFIQNSTEYKWQNLSEMEQLTSADFRSNNKGHAAKFFNLTQDEILNTNCASKYAEELTICQSVCNKIAKSYRSIFLKVHPDKHGGSDVAKNAAQNLVIVKETIFKHLTCPGK